jgi:pimeloyl-ACP methyl ester carboxylesterase
MTFSLYTQSRGQGPLVLMLQGGDGDADASNALADRMPDFEVLSYDRRGLSRSAAPEAAAGLELQTHTDDAARVLDGRPAFVFGTSIGANIGLDLLARYPQLVKKLVAHEPPVTELLPAGQQAEVERGRDEVDHIFRTKGVAAAMRKFLGATGVDFSDREPDVGLPPINPGRLQNLKFFLEHDAWAARRFRVDLAAVAAQADRVVIAAGEKSKGKWIRACAEALAQKLATPVVEFPGGHGGYASHPRGFAGLLRQLFV